LDNGPTFNDIVSFDERPDGTVWKIVTHKVLSPEKDPVDEEDDEPEQVILGDKPAILSTSTRDRLIAILG